MKITQQTIDLLNERKIFTTYNGTMRLKPGDNIWVYPDTKIEPFTSFIGGNALHTMGSFSYVWSDLKANTVVGRYSSISNWIRIFGPQHPYNSFTTSSFTYDGKFPIFTECNKDTSEEGFKIKPPVIPPEQQRITIGNDVWIGSHCALKPGITIHDGAVIATGAVVTKDVPPYAIVGGVPAKVIKMRFSDNIICEMLKLQWWDYCFADFKNMQGDIPVEEFIETIKQYIAEGKIQKFTPTPLTGEEILATQGG